MKTRIFASKYAQCKCRFSFSIYSTLIDFLFYVLNCRHKVQSTHQYASLSCLLVLCKRSDFGLDIWIFCWLFSLAVCSCFLVSFSHLCHMCICDTYFMPNVNIVTVSYCARFGCLSVSVSSYNTRRHGFRFVQSSFADLDKMADAVAKNSHAAQWFFFFYFI